MGDKNNGLRWIFLDFGEEVVALTLECFVEMLSAVRRRFPL